MTGPHALFEGTFRQTAWVTNDMDAALDIFARDYGVVTWFQRRDMDLQTGSGKFARINLALARRGNVEFELIHPLGNADEVYSHGLKSARDELQICFHHICYLVPTLEALERVRQAAALRGRAIVLSGSSESGASYFYTDDRATIGHYVEYIYCSPAYCARLETIVPVN
jgi:hypothetical protein